MTSRKRQINGTGKTMCYSGFRLGWTVGTMDNDVDRTYREPDEPKIYQRRPDAGERLFRGTDSHLGSSPELAGDSLEKGVRDNMAINNPFGLQ